CCAYPPTCRNRAACPASGLSRAMSKSIMDPARTSTNMTTKPRPPSEGPLLRPEPDEARTVPIRREEVPMVVAPRSQVAEQFRGLRNSITALNPDGAPRSVVLTSAVRGEGKSVATLNLAVALAELPGTEVLCVDADLHEPSLERYLGLPRRQGFADVLRGTCPLD